MARAERRVRGAQVSAVVAVAALAVGVGALSISALEKANPGRSAQTAAPVPSFTLGVQTASPTPTPTPTPAVAVARADERLLSSVSGTLWRATAGACGGVAPTLERSRDGVTWTDVTPFSTGLAQIASLDGLAVDGAEVVGATGAACQPQALRSYTDGQFWDTYPDVLALSRYVDPADPSVVHLATGRVAAPCPDARSLRARGSVVSLICDGVAYARAADQWLALPVSDSASVAIDGSDVLVAHVGDGCLGLAVTRFVGADPARPLAAGCADGIDPELPAAIASTPGGTLVWSGDVMITLP